ncbi:MAG: ATP-binding protein [Granulosicoccus sp.]
MSIRLKTILGVAAIEAVLLFVLIATVLDFIRTESEAALLQRAQTAAALFATTTKDAVLSFDLASLESFTAEVMKNPGLVYARVLGADGAVFAVAGDTAALSRPFVPDSTLVDVDDAIFDHFAEIREGPVVYGRVELGIGTDSIAQGIVSAQEMAHSIAVIEMLLVALFSFVLGTYLTHQLRVVSKGAKSISKGEFDIEIPVKGSDEVAAVARAFNKMVGNLRLMRQRREEYEQELLELNRTLEDRVARRTCSLEEKNNELSVANESIKKAQSQLLQSEKMASVGQLAAGVAHEINNPVGFINSNLETLKEYVSFYQILISHYNSLVEASDEAQRQVLSRQIAELQDEEDIEFVNEDIRSLLIDSIDGAQRVREIVQGMKDFSRIDGVEREFVSINDCIITALKLAANELKYKCEVATELPELPLISCNSGQLTQVILNLVVNASHAIEEDSQGEIIVRTATWGSGVRVDVEDNGCGIEQANLDKLFDPFFTTKPVGQGTGLGLAIVFGIVQDLGGEISVSSTPGQGTTFSIFLPSDVDQPEQNAA